jgi:hypothetical protein
MIEASAKTLLHIPCSYRLLLRDCMGDLVPCAASLPCADFQVVVFPADATARQPPITVEALDGSETYMPVAEEARGPAAVHDEVTPPRLEIPTKLTRQRMSGYTSTMIAHFIEAFTVKITNTDNVNFVPNHGPFALDRLFFVLVPPKFHPPDATSFYKIASSKVRLDRIRAIRYYYIPPTNEYIQLCPSGKGALLRAYLSEANLLSATRRHAVARVASSIGLPMADILLRYRAFLCDFTPISKSVYIRHTAKHALTS